MQENLDSAVNMINAHIKHLNRRNDVSTPLCHNVIIQRRGKRKGYEIHDWSALRDGVHGTYETRTLWAKSLKAAMDLNAKALEETFGSPKRSWKFEKRH